MERTRDRIMKYIIEYKALNDGTAPTYQEITDHVDGVSSKSVVSYHINVLCMTGYLRREIGKPKSLQVVKRPLPGNEA